MCVETKRIIKSQDVVFMEDSTSIENDLEMHPSERMVDVVDESFKSPCLCKDKNIEDMEEAKE